MFMGRASVYTNSLVGDFGQNGYETWKTAPTYRRRRTVPEREFARSLAPPFSADWPTARDNHKQAEEHAGKK